MRSHLAAAICAATLLWARSGLPCGGGFGTGISLDQKIVVSLKGGEETYFFSPHFCGSTAHFGLILPVPSALSSSPVLGDVNTVGELETITAPAVVRQTLCAGAGGGAEGGAGFVGGVLAEAGSAQVIDKGQVGVFDWSLIKADTAQAFTDWLDANQYPYSASAATQFAYYVAQAWYFVAFKVTADSQNPPSGSVLCGDLGPIQLAFPAADLVVPARIALASSSWSGGDGGVAGWFGWRVFTIAAHEMFVATPTPVEQFSGTLSASDLSSHAAVAKLATAGDRLTELEVDFSQAELASDLVFQATARDRDYRKTVYEYNYVSCDAGGRPDAGGAPEDSGLEAADGDDASAPLVDATVGPDATTRETPDGGGGCACSAVRRQRAPVWASWVGALPLVAALRARRRSARSPRR